MRLALPLRAARSAVVLTMAVALFAGVFCLRVAIRGNAAFANPAPRRITGKRAVHGEADWMKMADATKLFDDAGGIVIGERYRVDKDSVAAMPFRAEETPSWGAGGKSPLLCFDGAGGMPELVDDAVGFVVPYLDLAAMSAKIVALSESTVLVQELGQHAAVKVRERYVTAAAAPRIR